TPHYMSPEHLDAREVVPASDIYSVGVILYQMLSGKLPFDAPDIMSLIAKMLMESPTPLRTVRPDIDETLSHIVEKMMDRDLAVRYASAEAALHDLVPVAEAVR